jgi:thiol-disulfide isomerase/thioredoxin
VTNALAIGPFLFPLQLILLVLSIASSLAVASWLGRKRRVEAEATVWLSILVALVVARVAFVYEYRVLYLSSPLTILDIRDGGWNAAAGFMGGWLFALTRGRRDSKRAVPLWWALGFGTFVYIFGAGLISVRGGPEGSLPDLSLASLQERSTSLQSFKGKPVVVNLWATWCPPCVREMPTLSSAQVQRPDVNFVFVNQGEDDRSVNLWLLKQGITLENVLLDPKRQVSAIFKQQGYPTTLFFNADGNLSGIRTGELSSATLAHHLDALK